MKKLTLLSLLILFFYLIMNFPVPAHAQRTSGQAVQGESDPYEVTLYRQMNYAEPIGTWKLAPGMRMLKIPKIDKVPLSIFLGSAVGTLLFPDYNFSSSLKGVSGYDKGFLDGKPVNVKYYLIPFYKFTESTPKMYEKYVPDRCSLIIHRKDMKDWLGVSLENGYWSGQFYPLPEKAGDKAILYSKIPYGSDPYILSIMPGGDYSYSLYGSPNLADIDVTVTPVSGGKVKFPDPNNKTARYELKKYGIYQVSSLMIQYKGPLDQQAYIGPVRHRAPSAPDRPKPSPSYVMGVQSPQGTLAGPVKQTTPAKVMEITVPNMSGQWKSSIGLIYNITQQQNNFQWTVVNSSEKGNGTVKGYDVNATWQGPKGRGSSPGKITAVDTRGRAIKIIWKNGVQFYR
ncbi:MAG TPA: hypothetical protein DDY17_05595 [Syntrophaceae bacterium]|jgi:hypothetical protein|nr:hypothetical protein [Syntrophaceae bacterium]